MDPSVREFAVGKSHGLVYKLSTTLRESMTKQMQPSVLPLRDINHGFPSSRCNSCKENSSAVIFNSSLGGSYNVADVPKGYLAVYVGENERQQFIIPVSYLNQPSFQDLLSDAEQEFGFDHPMGGLTIPCRQDIFIDIISQF
ncbi:auxin-responsive protein SAUR27-like [Malus domestica]|uniref:auxin-responsive protein SAUR27-like n=1 Tax=Malus domestica TaxID=3750 RepID=UPI0010A9DA79|nr:auxin-responsive protein SAUR40-like [Malus domestica]